MRNGELGLYKLEKNVLLGQTMISNFSLGRLRAAELSPDLKWLAMSSSSRGGVWKLDDGKAVLYFRAFDGAYLDRDGSFIADFPKFQTQERSIAKVNLVTGAGTQTPGIESPHAHQLGQVITEFKSAKTDLKKEETPSLAKNVTLQVTDVRTMQPMWSKTYPQERPTLWIAPAWNSAVTAWSVSSDAAKEAIKKNSDLARRAASLKEKEGDYFIEVLDLKSGQLKGQLLIETGKGSFRISDAYAAGDRVIIADSENRVLVYSLSGGEIKGRAFGKYANLSPDGNTLCVENERGKLAFYDIETMNKKDELVFSDPLSFVRYSEDGKRLLVLTRNQFVYLIDANNRQAQSAQH
jgi:hypothetical protein